MILIQRLFCLFLHCKKKETLYIYLYIYIYTWANIQSTFFLRLDSELMASACYSSSQHSVMNSAIIKTNLTNCICGGKKSVLALHSGTYWSLKQNHLLKNKECETILLCWFSLRGKITEDLRCTFWTTLIDQEIGCSKKKKQQQHNTVGLWDCGTEKNSSAAPWRDKEFSFSSGMKGSQKERFLLQCCNVSHSRHSSFSALLWKKTVFYFLPWN